MKKVGVLIPQSKAYPVLGKEFLNGLRLEENDDYTIIVEGIGMGNDTEAICDRLDKLVLQEEISALIGFVGDNNLKLLYEKVNSLEVPTIFVRLGAFPNIEMENNEYCFSLSLDICDGLFNLGSHVVEKGGKEIAVSGSFNDVGYGLVEVLERSIYKAGGQFAGHYIPPNVPRDNEAEMASSFYDEVKFDASIQLYNGVFAEENIQYIEKLEKNIPEPMYFTPFGFDKSQMQRLKKKVENLFMVAPWVPMELRQDPTPLDNVYFAKFDKYPTFHAMLGYEAGQLLKEVLPARKGILENGASYNGQSGETKIGSDLIVRLNQKIWEASEVNGSWTLKENESLTKKENTPVLFEGQQSGWHNAYLCY
ncbi:MAG: hypothetical protein Crog4KO_11340 [Crocinitomicaceae bacterium]